MAYNKFFDFVDFIQSQAEMINFQEKFKLKHKQNSSK